VTTATTNSNSADDGRLVYRKLRQTWRCERRHTHLQAVCRLAIWLLSLFLLTWLVDWMFELPPAGRITLLAVNLAALLWVIYRHWWSQLHRFDPARTALQVERNYPQLRSLLISYVQFGPDSPEGARAPAALLNAMRRQAVEATTPIDFRRIVSFADLKRIALFAGAVVLAFGLVSINWSDHLRVLAQRLIAPTADVRYPTRTRVLETTGDLRIRQGDDVIIEAVAAGLVPQQGRLHIRPEGGQWQQLPLTRADGEPTAAGASNGASIRFARSFDRLLRGFEFYVEIGDDMGERHRVQVVAPPRMQDVAVTVTPPDYTGEETWVAEQLNLVDVPEGSRVHWRLTFDGPMQSVHMLREARGEEEATERIEMRLSEGGTVAEAELGLDESVSYGFEYVESSYGYSFAPEVRNFVQVVVDSPPRPLLLEPMTDERATVKRQLRLRYRLADDYGVGGAKLVLRREQTERDAEVHEVPLDVPPRSVIEGEQTIALRRAVPEVAPGDIVTYWIEAVDERDLPDRPPQPGESGVRRLTIVTEAEYLEYVRELVRQQMEQIRQFRDLEDEAAATLDELRERGPVAPEAP